MFDNAESQGVYLTLGKDENGNPVVQYAQGNRNKASVPFGTDADSVLPEGAFLQNRSAWNQVQAILKAMYKRQTQIEDYGARQKLKAAAKGEDALD